MMENLLLVCNIFELGLRTNQVKLDHILKLNIVSETLFDLVGLVYCPREISICGHLIRNRRNEQSNFSLSSTRFLNIFFHLL